MSDLEQQYNIANLNQQIAQKKLNASPKEVELLEMQLKVKQQELEDKKCIARFDGIIAKLSVYRFLSCQYTLSSQFRFHEFSGNFPPEFRTQAKSGCLRAD